MDSERLVLCLIIPTFPRSSLASTEVYLAPVPERSPRLLLGGNQI
jgi:hypothetical protein